MRLRAARLKNDFLDVDLAEQIDAVLGDYRTAYELLEAGKLDAYSGQFVAFLNGRLIAAGPDSVDLRTKASRKKHVHPDRLAVIHVFDEAVV